MKRNRIVWTFTLALLFSFGLMMFTHQTAVAKTYLRPLENRATRSQNYSIKRTMRVARVNGKTYGTMRVVYWKAFWRGQQVGIAPLYYSYHHLKHGGYILHEHGSRQTYYLPYVYNQKSRWLRSFKRRHKHARHIKKRRNSHGQINRRY